jgi:23S rRNA-/tRNA-specific pseudouridylate synthase
MLNSKVATYYKEYTALLEGELNLPTETVTTRTTRNHAADSTGNEYFEIDIPLALDLSNRPLQIVDHDNGKTAKTLIRILSKERHPHDAAKTCTRVILVPLTGRTHQLRVHCSNSQGLGHPIVGDVWYGPTPEKLCAIDKCHNNQTKSASIIGKRKSTEAVAGYLSEEDFSSQLGYVGISTSVQLNELESASLPAPASTIHGSFNQGPIEPSKQLQSTESVDSRLMLHASYLSFIHPQTCKRIEFRSNPPF